METKVKNQFSATDFLKLLPKMFTNLTLEEQKLSLAIYNGLAKGKPVNIEDLVRNASLNHDVVSGTIEKWPGIFYNNNKEIVGYWGLAISEMINKIQLKDQTLYGWCAWDTLFIPQLIRQKATIRSTCMTSKEEIVIELDEHGNLVSNNDNIVVSMLTVDEESIQDNVQTSFCHFIHFFKNEKAGKKWVSSNPDTFLISLREAIELSQTKNQLYGNLII